MEKEEFGQLVTELQTLIFNFALKKLPPEDARDVVSETFLVVWQKRDAAPRAPEELRRWTWGIANNKVKQAGQQRLRKHHDARFVADHVANDIRASDDPVARVVDADAARRLLASLPRGERDAVTAAASTDLPGSELAAMLGLSQSAFASRLSRGREKIARFLHNDGLVLEGEG